MAEREFYNDNGQWELIDSEGGYLQNPYPQEPAPQEPADPNAWLYNPNADPSGFPRLPNGWQWVWNGNQWTSNHNAGGPNGPAPPAPTPSTFDGGGGGGGGGDWGYLTEPFTGRPPAWQGLGGWAAPTFTPPPAFSYKEFTAPTSDSIYADPSYEFRSGEGLKALGQHKASKGTYLTGGTLKDFINYNQNAASQEYSNIFNRAVDTHNLGLSQALGTYGTNYGVSRDTYDRLFDASKAQYEAQERQNTQMNQREFDNFLANFDIFERNRRRAGDYLFQGAGLGGE